MPVKSDKFAPNLMRAYVDSYRGPQGDAPVIGDRGLDRAGPGARTAGLDTGPAGRA